MELVRRGVVPTPEEARRALASGRVTVDGSPAMNPGTLVDGHVAVALTGPEARFVSRGGDKLAAAIAAFDLGIDGRPCLDAGASTGGFTDCLLQAGAVHVVAVDVGYGQLAWRLRSDERVTVMERTNVRDLQRNDLPYAPSVVVADLSFVSLRSVLPALAHLAAADAAFVLLVKPQFEVSPSAVGNHGVVREPDVWRRALRQVLEAAASLGLQPRGAIPSPVRGPAGNVEFLVHLERSPQPIALDLDAVVREAEVAE